MSEPGSQSSTNPYEAPKAASEEAAVSAAELRLASGWLRFANLIIDFIAIQVLSFVLALAAAVTGVDLAGPISYVLGLVSTLIYYVGLELLAGRTLGKLITGTRVVNETGGSPRFGQIVGRSFARFVPFEPFSFLGTPSVGWHDSWSSTRVIKIR